MVASFAKLPLDAPHADNYLLRQHSAPVPGHDPIGTWWNPYGLFELEDGRQIRSRAFRNLFQGHAPQSERHSPQPLRRSTSRNQIAAFDICFAPDKSVSAVWALSSETLRKHIASAHNQAVLAALHLIVLEFCSCTRTRSDQGLQESIAGKPIGARFQRIASRSGDPQLRTHCVIFNLCQADDGYFRTLHGVQLYRWHKTAGSIYRNALAWNLTRDVGLAIEHYGTDDRLYRLPGIPKELLDLWSTRARAINKAIGRTVSKARPPATLKQAIATKTGPRKAFSSYPNLNNIVWELQATPILGDLAAFRETFTSFRKIPDEQHHLDNLRERLTAFHSSLFDEPLAKRVRIMIQAAADWSCGLMTPSAALALSYELMPPDDRADLDRYRSRPIGPANTRSDGSFIKPSINRKRPASRGKIRKA